MFVEWSQPIEKVDDALRLVEASYERQTSAFLIEARLLRADFFDLRTRFAGDFVQKLVNYGLRVALVAPDAAKHGERFAEFAAELVRNPVFRVFSERAQAEAWLGS
jgi:uncharacterized protein DUF4180